MLAQGNNLRLRDQGGSQGRGGARAQKTRTLSTCFRNTLSTARNSMTSSERPSPEPLLKKESLPQPYWARENSGNALEASNALNDRVWGIPAVLARKIAGNALRAFPEEIFRIFSGKFLPETLPAVLGALWPRMLEQLTQGGVFP